LQKSRIEAILNGMMPIKNSFESNNALQINLSISAETSTTTPSIYIYYTWKIDLINKIHPLLVAEHMLRFIARSPHYGTRTDTFIQFFMHTA
jgi:hypothetical protein